MAAVKASLFVTCLVDQLYPQVGEAVVRLLRRLDVEVMFPAAQTCCGQPALSSGFRSEARSLASQFLETFGESKYVVVPSGSCASMVRIFYPELFHGDRRLAEKARRVGGRVYELSEFLTRVLNRSDVGATYCGRVTYHPSCHLLRELEVDAAPKELIRAVRGVELVEGSGESPCCGFGGTFAIKYPDISEAMMEKKLREIEETRAEAVVACDMGCLMQIGGGLSRRRSPIRPMHLAELLASTDKPLPAASEAEED